MTSSLWTAPRSRPSAAIRALIGLGAAAVAAFNVALMLSDRAPGLTRRIFGDFALRLSNRLDASERLGEVAPGNDAIVHIGVWAVATVLVGCAVWRWSSLVIAAGLVFAGSIFVEIAQGRYSSTRVVEMSDITANGVGVIVGAAAVGLTYLVGSGLAATAERWQTA